ncbi:MAG: glucitol/sorbitol system component [Eubacteriaceae bacterium]|jgi:PTS system glucitol/sorbitol-specific IIC component|nr:glucitol/sorbitol system component [Eubacteriaceae bacterium]MDK2904483.1 glucitol/sorbitol system component [Eubacteriaceae bacterium]MDK2935142.1 glucitol/sorbitol system component [Eubacteriaceae bacterium]MDN5307514.1 glucitol/sorbitol system component [Eubacteriaceae bacterium]
MFSTVFIEKGQDGWGGPLLLEPSENKNKIVSITGGGIDEVSQKIADLSGGQAVDGFNEAVADQETLCVVINCGGMLRCGLYPKKEIPTINLVAIGPSGAFKDFMTEELYVSGVKQENVFRVENLEVFDALKPEPPVAIEAEEIVIEKEAAIKPKRKERKKNTRKNSENLLLNAGRETVDTAVKDILPMMVVFALMAGVIMYTGAGELMKDYLFPYLGTLPGLLLLSLFVAIPVFSPRLGSQAIVGQFLSLLIGIGIALSALPIYLALPALFAVNAQAGCDSLKKALAMAEADEDSTEIGVKAILISRLLTGPLSVGLAIMIALWLYGLM